ncbi:MAG: hypothetical protein J6K17_11970 [Oscillospiraceae bacterium]|nr:hypothetical protein [Oscillospiraceae bacterium]
MEDKTTLASGTIFDEAGYDEMQKAENHEIGFRLFRIMYFVMLLFTTVLIIVCSNTENLAGTIISLVLFAAMFGFYLLYAYMTAKRGIMNPKFAKSWSSTWILFLYPLLAILWSSRLISDIHHGDSFYDVVYCIMWLIISTEAVLMCLCAKKNNKVLKKQLEDDGE